MLRLISIIVLAGIVGGCAVAPVCGSAQHYGEDYVSDYPYGYAPGYGGVYIGSVWGDEHYGRIGYGRGHDHGDWFHSGGGGHGHGGGARVGGGHGGHGGGHGGGARRGPRLIFLALRE